MNTENNSIWYIDSNRNTLIEKTDYNNSKKWKEPISYEEKLVLGIKWKLDEIVSPEQVKWDYNYLSDREEIISNLKAYAVKKRLNIEWYYWIKVLDTDVLKNIWKIDIDQITLYILFQNWWYRNGDLVSK